MLNTPEAKTSQKAFSVFDILNLQIFSLADWGLGHDKIYTYWQVNKYTLVFFCY